MSQIRLLALLLICGPSVAFALDPSRNITQYVREAWAVDSGLPSAHVRRIAQTADRYLWFGTLEGLVRFDGIQFRLFDKRTTKEIKHNLIWELLAASDGSLWIGTFGGGITRLRNHVFTHFDLEEGVGDGIVISLYEDREGNIWIGTRDNGLYSYSKEKMHHYGSPEGLCNNSVNSVIEDRQGRIWIGTDDGLCLLQHQKILCYRSRDGLEDSNVLTLTEDQQDILWVGTNKGGLFLFREGRIRRHPTFPKVGIEALLTTRQGELWAATDNGVYSFTVDDLHVFLQEQGLAHKSAHSLLEDRNQNVWVATANGLTRIVDREASSLFSEDGLTGDAINSLLEDHEGSLWIATSTGVSRLRNGKSLNYTKREGLPSEEIGPIYQDREKNLWIGTVRDGLVLFKDGKFFRKDLRTSKVSNPAIYSLWKDRTSNLWIGTSEGVFRMKEDALDQFRMADGLPDNNVRVVYEDPSGNVWIGTEGGLALWKYGRFHAYTQHHGLSNVYVRFIYQDSKGNLWIGTDRGLNLFQNGRFETYTTDDGLSNVVLRAIHEDSNGTLWIGTIGGGINRFDGKNFKAITVDQGLSDDTVFQILEDRHGYFWMSSNKGISRVSRKELDEFALGKRRSIHSLSFDRADGLLSEQCRSGVFPAGWKTADGDLWFPTDAGLVRMNPDQIPFNRIEPRIHIEQVVVEDRKIRPPWIGKSLAFEPGSRKFEFHYAGLSFETPKKVKFSYILEGFDHNWVDSGTRRVAYYTNIPPGNYQFRVIACNNDGIWNKTGDSVDFYLRPYFHQTGWFYLLCFLSVIAFILAVLRFRLHQLQSRFAAVLAERNRISRELHDTLAQGLTGISLHLKNVDDTMANEPDVAKKHLEIARSLAKTSQTEARRFLQDLRPELLQKGNLPEALRHLASQLLTGTFIQFTLRTNGEYQTLPELVETNLFRIAQEGITNSIKHANPKNIHLELEYSDSYVSMRLQDDGKGFLPEAIIKDSRIHFGLISISERIEQLHGELKISCQPDQGTVIFARIPYQ